MDDIKISKKPSIGLKTIEQLADVYEEVFVAPKKAGVVGVQLSNSERKIMYHGLAWLSQVLSSNDVRCQESFGFKAQVLYERLLNMGKILGFTEKGYYFAQDWESSISDIDFAKPLPHLADNPYFVWRPHQGIFDVLHGFREAIDFRDREIGPISDSRNNVAYSNQSGSFTVFTQQEHSMVCHGLELIKSRKHMPKEADTILQFNCGYDPFEGFMAGFSFFLKDGKVVKIGGMDLTTEDDALAFLADEIHLYPRQVEYYLTHSNLSSEHRKDLAGVIEALQKPVKISSYSRDKKSAIQIAKTKPALDPRFVDPESSKIMGIIQRFQEMAEGIIKSARSIGLRVLPPGSLDVSLIESDDSIDVNSLRLVYRDSRVDDLTCEEFSRLSLLNYGNSTVEIHFKISEKGKNRYTATYFYHKEEGHPGKVDQKGDPIIRLLGPKDMESFNKIMTALVKQTKGRVHEKPVERSDDLLVDIIIPREHSLHQIKMDVGEFFCGQYYSVRIPHIYFKNISPEELSVLGAPSHKVSYEDPILIKPTE